MQVPWSSVVQALLNPEAHASTYEQLLAENSSIVLFSADVDRIQDYVFESVRLPEIRGGSLLIDQLCQEAAAKHLKDYVIYNGGGSLLALLPDLDTAETAKREIEALFPQQTGAATITCVAYQTNVKELLEGYLPHVSPPELWVLRSSRQREAWQQLTQAYGLTESVKEDEFTAAANRQLAEQNHFGQMVKLMSILLRRQKDQRRNITFYDGLAQAEWCRSCGYRPAQLIGRYNDVVDQNWPLCEPCWCKLKNRRQVREAVQGRVSARLSRAPDYYSQTAGHEVELPDDLSDIGQACRARAGYIALVYTDGDSIGRYMSQQQSPATYKQASDALATSTEAAVGAVLATHLPPAFIDRQNIDTGEQQKNVLIYPFELLTIGGDDVLLFVPADVALPVALTICTTFQTEIQSRLGQTLTMSAGVVLASAHTPVRSLRSIAQQLCQSAKQRAKTHRAKNEPVGAVDFLILTSQSLLRRDLDDLRRTFPYQVKGEGSDATHLRLTGAPYLLPELEALLDLLAEMRHLNFPASQLQQIASALRAGRERGSLYFLYQQARTKKKEYGPIFDRIEQFIEQYQPDFDPRLDPFPWQRARALPKVGYTSIVPDLADLFSFTRG
jgi:hypothetical protein